MLQDVAWSELRANHPDRYLPPDDAKTLSSTTTSHSDIQSDRAVKTNKVPSPTAQPSPAPSVGTDYGDINLEALATGTFDHLASPVRSTVIRDIAGSSGMLEDLRDRVPLAELSRLSASLHPAHHRLSHHHTLEPRSESYELPRLTQHSDEIAHIMDEFHQLVGQLKDQHAVPVTKLEHSHSMHMSSQPRVWPEKDSDHTEGAFTTTQHSKHHWEEPKQTSWSGKREVLSLDQVDRLTALMKRGKHVGATYSAERQDHIDRYEKSAVESSAADKMAYQRPSEDSISRGTRPTVSAPASLAVSLGRDALDDEDAESLTYTQLYHLADKKVTERYPVDSYHDSGDSDDAGASSAASHQAFFSRYGDQYEMNDYEHMGIGASTAIPLHSSTRSDQGANPSSMQ